MNKVSVAVLIMLILFLAEVARAQKAHVAIVKSTVPGVKSEFISITEEQLHMLYENQLSPQELFLSKSNTILDTLQNIGLGGVNWGIAVEESLLCYFDPPSPCYIKAVGIQVRRWGNSRLCNGYCLRLTKANYKWDFSSAAWQGDSLYLGRWKNNIWQGNNFDPPLGPMMWGDFPMTAEEDAFHWIDMVYLGEEPDNKEQPFHVVVMPYGELGTFIATLATALDANDSRDYLKLAQYHDDIGWIVYNYALNWYVVVECYGNKPPTVTFDRAGSTMELGTRFVHCTITDEDVTDVTKAGVKNASLHFSINKAAYDSMTMILESGTIENGIWRGEISGNRIPGDLVTYYFSATDRGAPGRYVVSAPVWYRVVKKEHELLVVSNDDLKSFFPLLDCKYDYWSPSNDGPLFDQLVSQYDHIVQLGEFGRFSHVIENDEIIGNWINTGTTDNPKNYFLSSATWANVLTNDKGTTFSANDWHNLYLGIDKLGPLDFTQDPWSSLSLNAIPEDVVSGKIASFCGDNLQLYYASGEADAFMPATNSIVCFTDSATGVAVGCHKEGDGFKTVFLPFDYRFLFTKPDFWITYHYDNLLGRVLEWFGTPTSQVNSNEGDNPSTFRLSQNYPNPFNLETVIEYNIWKPSKVRLAVFNLTGQKIANLVDEYQIANSYKIIWNAQGLPSGIYFCKMETENFSKTLKLILIK